MGQEDTSQSRSQTRGISIPSLQSIHDTDSEDAERCLDLMRGRCVIQAWSKAESDAPTQIPGLGVSWELTHTNASITHYPFYFPSLTGYPVVTYLEFGL